MAQHSNLLKHFGKRLSELRRRRDLTQQQLAGKADISITSLAFIETGKRWPRPETIERLAEALDVPIIEFFKEFE
jgi:transcriptional regulator with XRE-family HTH domain